MTNEKAKEYAKNMSYRDAVHNALQGRCIPYHKATIIKLCEMLDMIESQESEVKMTVKKAKEYIDIAIKRTWNNKIYREIKEALKQDECSDCISREAVINHICESKDCYVKDCKGKLYKRCCDIEWIYDLPPVTPQPKESEV